MRGRAVWLALAAAQLVALGPARCRGFPAPAHPDWQETFSARDYKHDFCAVAATVLESLREAPAGDPRGAGAGALRNALRGLNLSTAWPPPEDYEPPGLLEGDASGVISDGGAMAKIFDELARRAGFNWRNHYGLVEIPDGPEFEDKTWNELLIWSADVYDVSVDWWIETPSRKEIGIFFPQGWFDASLVLVAKKQGAKLNVANLLFSWSKPFAPELWFLVLVMFVFAGVVYWVVEDGDLDGDGKDRNKAEFQYKFKWQNVLVSILNTALEFAGGKWHTPHTFSGRVFTFGWLFARLLLISAYTANLASTFITDALENYGVESIEDAVSRELPICISGVVSGPLLKSLHPDIDLVEVEDDQMFSAINDGTCVGSVMSYDEWRIQMGIKELNPDCQFGLVGRNIKYMQAGFAVKHSSDKCSWLVRDVLDLHLHDMTDDGFVDEVWKDHFKKTREQKCSPPSVGKPTQMKPSNTAGIFILMLLTSVLAMLLSSFQTATCAWGGLADGDDDGREEVRTTKRGKSSLKDKGGSFSGTETKGRGGAGRAPEPLLSASLVRPDHPAAYGQLRESFLVKELPMGDSHLRDRGREPADLHDALQQLEAENQAASEANKRVAAALELVRKFGAGKETEWKTKAGDKSDSLQHTSSMVRFSENGELPSHSPKIPVPRGFGESPQIPVPRGFGGAFVNVIGNREDGVELASPQTSESRDRVGEKQTSINVPITSNGEGSRSTLYGAGNTEGASNGDGTSIYTSGGGSQSPTRIVSPDVASLRFRAEGKALS